MTEKRFFGTAKGHREHIIDCTGRLYSDSEVVDMLENYEKENEGLNAKNKVLRKEIERLKTQNEDILYNNAKNMELLEKENKQLKQSYKEFEDECQSTFNAMSRKQNDLYRKNFKLKEENEELKSDNNRLVNETAKIVAEHQRKVLDLIDEKIDELEGRYKFGQEVYKGCPMHNIRFGINVLKELKRELQE